MVKTYPALALALIALMGITIGCGSGVSEADRSCQEACEVIFDCGWNIAGSEKECVQACKEEDNAGFVDCMSDLEGCDPYAGKTCLEMLD